MKKFLLLSGLSLLAAFSLTACDDSSDGGGWTAPAIVSPDYESLSGTYEIEFFYTNAGIVVLTNNCYAISAYAGAGAAQCQYPATDSSDFQGKGTIRYDNETGLLHVATKVQLSGGAFERARSMGLGSQVDPNKYNYTVFTPIPVNATIDNIINNQRSEESVKGVTGRNATAKTPEKASENTYQFTVYADGAVVNNMTDKSVMDVPVVVRMKKISDTVEDLLPNEAFETPDISDVFKKDVGYSPQAE